MTAKHITLASARDCDLVMRHQYAHLDHIAVRAAIGNPFHLFLYVFVDHVFVSKLLGCQLAEAPGNRDLAEEFGDEGPTGR